MKKRILMTLTVMSLIAAGLTGCGGSEKKETQAAATTATEAATEAADETEATDETKAADETTAETGDGKAYEAGTTTETGWESQWLNMKFTAAEGVTLMPEEEREMVLPSVKEGENIFVYEMMANNADGAASVGVIVEKSELSPEAYMEVMLEQIQGDHVEGMTFSVTQEITDGEFLGHAVKLMQVDSTYQDVKVNQTYMIYEQDGFLIEIIGTDTVADGKALETLMSAFTTLE